MLHEQGLAVGREAGDSWVVAICLGDLGDVRQARGDAEAARRLYEQSLAAWRELGDPRGVAQCLEGFAGLAADTQIARAVRLFGAAATVREMIGEPCSPVRKIELDRKLWRARGVLGSKAYGEAWSDGQAMPTDRAIEYALEQAVEASMPTRGGAVASRAGARAAHAARGRGRPTGRRGLDQPRDRR